MRREDSQFIGEEVVPAAGLTPGVAAWKRLLFWPLIFAAAPLLACKCEMQLSVCQEAAYSGTIFIGTVESIAPNFLNRWNLAQPQSMSRINRANERYLSDRSATNLTALKDELHKAFPDLSADEKRRLDDAANHQTMAALFSSVLEHGKRIHFRVRTVFRNGDDDDGDDDAGAPRTFDVWTPFSECGYDFQEGETYLVYATDDEESTTLETDSCSRTRRLSDAGSDLPYLYFYKDREHPAGRLEGFTTFDPLYQVKRATAHDPDTIAAPAADVMVELRGSHGSRYTPSDAAGRFIFDGLDAGDYQVAAYAAGFPEVIRQIAEPKRVRMNERGCASQILLIPRPAR